ncbi:MAG: hypothetical protein O2856_16115 [Planctomycetota bacterium]|nr:hypothetical protein [Planctomycetota bacterium]
MKLASSLLAAAIVVVGVAFAYSTTNDAHASDSPVVDADDAAPVEESMHEFMEYVFQPTYLRLKATMATAPADNKGWKALKSDSLILAESCNLLFVRQPDEHADDWTKHAIAAKASGAELYKAAREKNFEAASTAYKAMLNNCNACHKQFEEGKHMLQP